LKTGSYTVPSNVTTITIEAMGGGGGGSSGGTGSDIAWAGGGGGGCGALEKIAIPVTSRQVMDFTIGVGGAGGAQPTQSGGNGTSTTITLVELLMEVWALLVLMEAMGQLL